MKNKPLYAVKCKKLKYKVCVYKSALIGFSVYGYDSLNIEEFLQVINDQLAACEWARLHCAELDNKLM